MDFLQLKDKTILVCGMANRKSVAYHVGAVLAEAGARVDFAVRSEERRQQAAKIVGEAPVFVCDMDHQDQIERMRDEVQAACGTIQGLVHSLAFADYSAGWLPFHQTPRSAFLQAVDISCFSLIALANAFRDTLERDTGSVAAISISTTRMAAENYGYGPIKAAVDSRSASGQVVLAISQVRFNAVSPGLPKARPRRAFPDTSKATLRWQATLGSELSKRVRSRTPSRSSSARSSGINAQAW